MSSNSDQRQQPGQTGQKEAEALSVLAQATRHQPSSSTAPLNEMPGTPSRRRHTDAQGLVPATPTRVERATTVSGLFTQTTQTTQAGPSRGHNPYMRPTAPRPWFEQHALLPADPSSHWQLMQPTHLRPEDPCSAPIPVSAGLTPSPPLAPSPRLTPSPRPSMIPRRVSKQPSASAQGTAGGDNQYLDHGSTSQGIRGMGPSSSVQASLPHARITGPALGLPAQGLGAPLPSVSQLPLGSSTNQLHQLPPIDSRRASQPSNLPQPWNPSHSSRWSQQPPATAHPSIPSRMPQNHQQNVLPPLRPETITKSLLPIAAIQNTGAQPRLVMRDSSSPESRQRSQSSEIMSSVHLPSPPSVLRPSVSSLYSASRPGLTGMPNATATFAQGVQRSVPPAQLDDLRIDEPTSSQVTQPQQPSMSSTMAPTIAPSTLLWPPGAKSSTNAPKKTIGSVPEGTSLTHLAIAAAQAAPLPHPPCDPSNTLPSAHGVPIPGGPLSNPSKSASGRTRRLASLAIATSSPSAGGPAASAGKCKGKGKNKAKRPRAERSESSQSSEIGNDAPPSSSHARALRWMPVSVAGESPQALKGGSGSGLQKASTAPQVVTEPVVPSTQSAIVELCEDLRQVRLQSAGRRSAFWNEYFVWSGSLSIQSGLFRDANVLCEEMRILHGKVYQQLERFEGFRINHHRLIQGLTSDCIKLWEEQDAFYSRLSALLPNDQVAANVPVTASDEPSAQALTGTSEGPNTQST
ncbi:hypothetical protein IE81DRAFT_183895 [Ceraceosorus guamensis]|uniref:Uncharacterized protein n=1 Tax=Ceraceosorus guamensis TaxID=1522189 RepID=A0A316W0G0_9BASI|nr:hypothetical protein IE81DRAFT_183895 [Ceraceosorus guamensis]PWN41185.1 hypothetical protein IE81DRAFT_183895 [Ceraceosorus guamensis]